MSGWHQGCRTPPVAPRTETPLERELLYLARHGTADGNVARRHLGLLDEPLNEVGRAQARDLARRLRGTPLSAIWTSPLVRARETASILASALRLPLRVEDDLHEMTLGPWEGLTEAEIAERFPSEHALWKADPAALRLEGHETLEALRARVAGALERILVMDPRPLCVTHLSVMRMARVHLLGLDLNSYGTISPEHCAPIVIERSGARTDWRDVA